MENDKICPICGFDGMKTPAYELHPIYSECPCCGMEFNLRGLTHPFRQVRIHWIYASMEFAWKTDLDVGKIANDIKTQLGNIYKIDKIDYFEKFRNSIKEINLPDWPVFLRDDEIDFVDKLEIVFKGMVKSARLEILGVERGEAQERQ